MSQKKMINLLLSYFIKQNDIFKVLFVEGWPHLSLTHHLRSNPNTTYQRLHFHGFYLCKGVVGNSCCEVGWALAIKLTCGCDPPPTNQPTIHPSIHPANHGAHQVLPVPWHCIVLPWERGRRYPRPLCIIIVINNSISIIPIWVWQHLLVFISSCPHHSLPAGLCNPTVVASDHEHSPPHLPMLPFMLPGNHGLFGLLPSYCSFEWLVCQIFLFLVNGWCTEELDTFPPPLSGFGKFTLWEYCTRVKRWRCDI